MRNSISGYELFYSKTELTNVELIALYLGKTIAYVKEKMEEDNDAYTCNTLFQEAMETQYSPMQVLLLK